MRIDDDVAETLAQNSFDGGLQLGRRPHDVGDQPFDPAGALPLLVLAHDRAHAALKAFVALLDFLQRRQARAPPVRLFPKRLQLQLAARELAANHRQRRFVILHALARRLDALADRFDLLAQRALFGDEGGQTLGRGAVLARQTVEAGPQIVAAVLGGRAFGLDARDSRRGRAHFAQRRFQRASRLGQGRAPVLLHRRFFVVLLPAALGVGLDVAEPVLNLLDFGAAQHGPGAQLLRFLGCRLGARAQIRGFSLVVRRPLHAQLRLVRQREQIVLRRGQLTGLLGNRQPFDLDRRLVGRHGRGLIFMQLADVHQLRGRRLLFGQVTEVPLRRRPQVEVTQLRLCSACSARPSERPTATSAAGLQSRSRRPKPAAGAAGSNPSGARRPFSWPCTA